MHQNPTSPPPSSWSISSQSQQIQNRFQQYLSSITTQTLFLFGLCIFFAFINIFTIDDLVSRAFTLDRIEIKTHFFSFSSTILLVLNCFSPLHGLFVVLISCYLAKEIFVEYETKLLAYFLPFLTLCQLFISIFSLLLDQIWYASFYQGWSRFVNQYLLRWLEKPNDVVSITYLAGFGGLLPLYLCLETEKSFSSSSIREEQVELPMIPFTVARKYKGFVIAFLLSIFNGGDVDLFAGVSVGIFVSMTQKIFVWIQLRREQVSSASAAATTVGRNYGGSVSNGTLEEAASLLSTTTNKQAASNTAHASTTNHSAIQETEKRAVLLAAAEKRLGEREPDSHQKQGGSMV